MIHTFSVRLADFITSYSHRNEQNRDIYIYGSECFLNLLACDSILFLYAAICHEIPAFFFWHISYSMLRSHAGGYHAGSHASCIMKSILMGMACLHFYHLLSPAHPSFICFLALSGWLIFRHSPVISPAHPLSNGQIKKEHRLSLIIYAAECIAIFLLLHISPRYSSAFASGMTAACIFMAAGHMKYRPEKLQTM